MRMVFSLLTLESWNLRVTRNLSDPYPKRNPHHDTLDKRSSGLYSNSLHEENPLSSEAALPFGDSSPCWEVCSASSQDFSLCDFYSLLPILFSGAKWNESIPYSTWETFKYLKTAITSPSSLFSQAKYLPTPSICLYMTWTQGPLPSWFVLLRTYISTYWCP